MYSGVRQRIQAGAIRLRLDRVYPSHHFAFHPRRGEGYRRSKGGYYGQKGKTDKKTCWIGGEMKIEKARWSDGT